MTRTQRDIQRKPRVFNHSKKIGDIMILLSKSGHKESDGYNHFWRCSNEKETQAIYERI